MCICVFVCVCVYLREEDQVCEHVLFLVCVCLREKRRKVCFVCLSETWGEKLGDDSSVSVCF